MPHFIQKSSKDHPLPYA